MLVRDPEVHTYHRTAVTAATLSHEVPKRLMGETDARVVRGYGQAEFGLICWDVYGTGDEPVQRLTYEGTVRFNGEQAVIRKWSASSGAYEDLESSTDVSGFTPYPVLEEGASDSGPESDEQVANNLKFACEYVEGEGDEPPAMLLRLWVNDELVVRTEDPDPLTDEASTEDVIRRFSLAQNPGSNSRPIGVLFENFHLHEIHPD